MGSDPSGIAQKPYSAMVIPALDMIDVVPDDNVDLPKTARRLRVTGTAGNIVVSTVSGDATRIIKNVAVGETIELFVGRVLSTGTTATGIEAYF